MRPLLPYSGSIQMGCNWQDAVALLLRVQRQRSCSNHQLKDRPMNVKSKSVINVACFQLPILLSTSGAECLMVCMRQRQYALSGRRGVFGSVWSYSAGIMQLIM